MSQKMSNDIPDRVVMKYIKGERDKYKNKLETLIPYTKGLEAKLKELTARNIALEETAKDYEDLKKLRKQVDGVLKEKESLLAENSALIKDYKTSEWYAQLKADRKRLRKENRALKIALNHYLVSNKFAIEQDDED